MGGAMGRAKRGAVEWLNSPNSDYGSMKEKRDNQGKRYDPRRTRTYNPQIKSLLLYQLS